MKLFTQQFKKNNIGYVLSIVILIFSQTVFSQNIPSTDGDGFQGATNVGTPCSNCVPSGWVDDGGTPDLSSNTQAATNGTGGGGSQWVNAPLPFPPNGHTSWLSLRDLGAAGTEESVRTTISGLVVGRTYEVIVYSLTSLSDDSGIGGPGINGYYSGAYNDAFRFNVDGGALQNVSPITQEVWGTSKLRFTASATSEILRIFPGNNSAYTGSGAGGNGRINIESVQVSVTLNAINAVPIATNNSDTTPFNTATTFNVTSDDSDPDGNIVPSTVDLDPSTPGIQNSIVTAQGT
jgi:hypothetical protein